MDVEYVIYETPHPPDTDQPCEDEPDTACPDTEKVSVHFSRTSRETMSDKLVRLIERDAVKQ